MIAIFALVRLSRKEHVDLVFSNTTAVTIGAAISSLLRIPHIWHVHEQFEDPRLLVRLLGWAINNCCERAIVVSSSVRDHWIQHGKVSPDKLHVLYNGIDAIAVSSCSAIDLRAELGLSQDILLVGMIGRVHFWKGQEYFLDICSHIHRRYPKVRFVMAGDAFPGYEYLYESLESRKQQLGLVSVIFDLGYRADAVALLKNLDIFVLPSTKPDPLPTVVLEAMACLKPVVATAHGGAREMVDHGSTGFLIPWDNAAKAFDVMQPLLEDERLRTRMGLCGRKRLDEMFSLERFESGIQELLSNCT